MPGPPLGVTVQPVVVAVTGVMLKAAWPSTSAWEAGSASLGSLVTTETVFSLVSAM